MKYLILLISMVSTLASAQSLYSAYDNINGYFYFSKSEQVAGPGLISNSNTQQWLTDIAVFNPNTGETNQLFKARKQKLVVGFAYAHDFQSDDFANEIEMAGVGIVDLMLNARIADKTNFNPKMIVVTKESANANELQIWSANSDGSNLMPIAKVQTGQSWHVDIARQQVRILANPTGNVTIESFSL